MESSKVGYWLQVGANIGILVGLILVGLQIGQTSDLLKLQLLYEDDGREIENESTLLGDNPTQIVQKAMDSPYELTFGEMRLLEAYHYRPYAQLERRYRARDLLGDTWKNDISDIAWMYGTPIGRAWWDSVREGSPPEVRALLDDALAGQEPTFQQDQFDRIKANLAKYLDEEDQRLESPIAEVGLREVQNWFNGYAALWLEPKLSDVPNIVDHFVTPMHLVDESGVVFISNRAELSSRYTRLLENPSEQNYSGNLLLMADVQLLSEKSARVDADWMELDQDRNPKNCFGRSYNLILNGDDWKISGSFLRNCRASSRP